MLKIAHFADIHILNVVEKLKEQKSQFFKVYTELKNEKPDIVVIAGDFLDKSLMGNEAKATASEFLNEILKFTNLIILTLGNHEANQKNASRISSIESLIKIMGNKDIIFLNENGFYNFPQYEGISFVNWKWGEYVNPYIDLNIEYEANKNKFLIDLYHNPINGSYNSFGRTFKEVNYLSLDDFKGDLLLAGDIHQRQFFNKDNKVFGAYSSSLFQLNFGESIDKHGFLIWEINEENKSYTYKEIDIDSDYLYLNLDVNEGFDYENINIELPVIKDNVRLKIKWNDYSANITRNNEREIKKYLLTKYPQIKEIKKEVNKLDVHKNNTSNDTNLSNISSKVVQRTILNEYLKNNLKIEDENVINDILLLDDEIESKLEKNIDSDELFTWEIENFWLDNFRSHGDVFELDWKDKNGLWKIDGKNEEGKTNLWSSICYLCHGKTIETKKKLKFGDNRFINNKRNLDYCEVGAIIKMNEERFSIKRRTERKWNRYNTELVSCSTTFKINKVDNDNNIIEFLNEDEGRKTTKDFENCVGDFDDFLRLSIITSDTLNSILTLDEAEFIDSILKDAGLDVYEKKLTSYKKLKSETFKKEERVVIDVLMAEKEIENNKTLISSFEEEILGFEEKISDKDNRIKKGIELKEEEIKKLHKIDEVLKKINIDDKKNEINTFIKEKESKYDEIEMLNEKIITLKNSYDKNSYDNLKTDKEKLSVQIIDSRQEIKKLNLEIEQESHNISKINGDILLLNREISNIKNQIENEVAFLDKQINNLNLEINILEKSKVCPSCNRELNENAISTISIKIDSLKNEIKNKEDEKITGKKIINLNEEIKIKEVSIVTKEKSKSPHQERIQKIKEEFIPDLNKLIDDNRLILEKIEIGIKKIDLEISEIVLRDKLLTEKENIPLQIENIDLKIQNIKNIIESFNINLIRINDNFKIEEKIKIFQERLTVLIDEKNDLLSNINKIKNNDINTLYIKNKNIEEKIIKFKEQERKEMINKFYQDSLSRDGIPKLLLLRMKDTINIEIENLLQDVKFSVYFDENLSLKLSDNIKPEAEINVIESSGKQRTFAAFALKLALRSINNRSTNNMLILDEVTSKLVDNSVGEFFNLLEVAKSKIDKIIIIEHAYTDELLVDHSLEVIKDNEGVSKISLN